MTARRWKEICNDLAQCDDGFEFQNISFHLGNELEEFYRLMPRYGGWVGKIRLWWDSRA